MHVAPEGLVRESCRDLARAEICRVAPRSHVTAATLTASYLNLLGQARRGGDEARAK